jgi:CBS domain-containing protein
MTTVKEILASKKSQIFFTKSTDDVSIALQMMKDHRVRAILVIDDQVLKGIVTQGDCAIKVLLAEKDLKTTLAGDIMTPTPMVIDENFTLEQCMSIMAAKKLRHLPVVNNQLVVGVVSIGDLVGDIIQKQTSQIQFLETYMQGYGLDAKSNSHFSFLG